MKPDQYLKLLFVAVQDPQLSNVRLREDAEWAKQQESREDTVWCSRVESQGAMETLTLTLRLILFQENKDQNDRKKPECEIWNIN